jgi:3-hydroxyisobutyrate dehydrogenase-like beta-hydroxyacid dehydrogenase
MPHTATAPAQTPHDRPREPGSTSALSPAGFVGLGAMGSQLATRLLDAGHRVHATNRTASKARPLIERGLVWRATPREVAATSRVVLSMVSDDHAHDAISAGPDGLLAGLQPGQVYVDMSTVSPRASRRLAEQVRERGAHMLDAPVSGSIPQAQNGTLAIMAGGEPHAFATVQPLLRGLGNPVTHVGPNGQGLLLKLAINISLAVQTLAFSEGLLLAERAGVDPGVATQVMSTSSIGSPMLKARIPLLLDLPEHAWFDVELMQKDIRLARGAANETHTPLPSATVADQLLTRARNLGYAHRDLAAFHELLAHDAVGES